MTGEAPPLAAYRRAVPIGPPQSRRGGRVWAWTYNVAAAAVAVAAGTTIGLALTTAALRHGEEIGAVTVGSWRLPVGEGTPGINPYQRAVLARTGAVPMSTGQGVAFTATRDQAGRKLDRGCTYLVSGPVPRARFWTVAVTDQNGFAVPNEADRFAFTSAEVLRDETGAFGIVVSPGVEPGNWLPLRGKGPFTLVLRLYDSAVPGLGTRELAALAMPTIERTRCG